jgi:methionyl-tRNA formyltransferase
MGTPDFALFSLKALFESGEDIVAVITQPDKPTGRGYVLTPPPVKRWALENNIPVYQPKTLRDEEFASLLAELDPELIVVVAFGKILPKNVLDYPKHGCINVHGSLLPEYRGAAPMQRAIIDGKKVTGVTTMYMAEGLDTGDMLMKTEVEILPNDNFEDIHDKLGAVGADTLLRTVDAIKNGTLSPEPQDDSLSNYAAKIEKADCLIDFAKDANTVHNLIRGLSPIPLSFTHTPDGKLLKVVKSEVVDADSENRAPAGTVTATDGAITVACGKGKINLLTVVPEGKSRMSGADFIRGRKVKEGDILK